MSKSKGNVIYADDLIKLFGVDAVRYYLLSEMPFANDGSITFEAMIERFNSDLANTLGNLVNRTIAMNNKYFGGIVQSPVAKTDLDKELEDFCFETMAKVEKNIDTFHMSDCLEAVINLAKRCNKYIDETTPWALAKNEEDKERLGTVLYNLLESIRFIAVLLTPFMPDTAKAIFAQMNCDIDTYDSLDSFGKLKAGTKLSEATPLFVRVDAEKMFQEIEAARMEAQKTSKSMEEVNEETEKKPLYEGIAQIGIEDFGKVDLRVAQIVECEPVKKAKKLLKLTLNDGEKERTVASGIAQYYKPEELKGHKVILVQNLKPATLCGVESHGMILAADTNGTVKVIFVDGMDNGAKVR